MHTRVSTCEPASMCDTCGHASVRGDRSNTWVVVNILTSNFDDLRGFTESVAHGHARILFLVDILTHLAQNFT